MLSLCLFWEVSETAFWDVDLRWLPWLSRGTLPGMVVFIFLWQVYMLSLPICKEEGAKWKKWVWDQNWSPFQMWPWIHCKFYPIFLANSCENLGPKNYIIYKWENLVNWIFTEMNHQICHNWIENLCLSFKSWIPAACFLQVCGFDVKQDRLRIPSTKRLALVGIPRPTTALERIERLRRITWFVEGYSHDPKGFRVREPSPVRNCTKIPANVCERILQKVLLQLLEHRGVEDGWNIGGEYQLPNLVNHLSSDTLQELKLQHGGLQTLLRNNSHIFTCKKGRVSLRRPTPIDRESLDRSSKVYQKWKTRKCFLERFHPEGCPLDVNSCCYDR